MKKESAFVVLVDQPAEQPALAPYAARLAEACGARLVLLHVYADLLLDPEFSYASELVQSCRQTLATELRTLAGTLPVPATAETTDDGLRTAVAEAMRRHHPLLLVAGLAATHDWFDSLFSNAALPVMRETHHPLLLVPNQSRRRPMTPRRVLLAVDGEPFAITPTGQGATALFAGWQAKYQVLHVRPEAEVMTDGVLPQPGAVLEQVRRGLNCQLGLTNLDCHFRYDTSPAEGTLRAVADLQPDLLVLVARRRSFLGELFHRSVTAFILREVNIPVLLLPAE